MEKIQNKIGERLSPILTEIETALFENQFYMQELIDNNIDCESKPNYTYEAFRSGVKIFMDVCLEKIYENDLKNNKTQLEMEQHAEDFGTAIKTLIRDYIDIDTTKLY